MHSLKFRKTFKMAILSQAREGRCRDLTGGTLRGEDKVQLTFRETFSEMKIRCRLCGVWVRLPPGLQKVRCYQGQWQNLSINREQQGDAVFLASLDK